jgi:hypothetical protein
VQRFREELPQISPLRCAPVEMTKGRLVVVRSSGQGRYHWCFSRLMRSWRAHQKGNVAHLINYFSGRVGQGLDFSCTHRIESGD